MSSPLIDMLVSDHGFTRLSTMEEHDAFVAGGIPSVLFVPGDPRRNLESTDVAVILPELARAFRGRFTVALVDDAIETEVRTRHESFQTPVLIFCANGETIGSIPKVRDWSDYMERVGTLLNRAALPAAE
ncbi:MAG: hydrogenase accessory protein [Rubricella sp.]